MNHRKIILLLTTALALFCPTTAVAQEYNATYKDATIEQVILDLRQKTGYEFVYQRKIIEGIAPITCSCNHVSFTQLLDCVIYDAAELDYEIVDKTVILSQQEQLPTTKVLIGGIVVDEQQEPLVGATILQEGTPTYTTTDLDGAFTFFVNGKDPIITVSYVGMKNQSVRVKSQKETFFLVKMETDTHILEEVIVTGYQNIKRENATGSYHTVTSRDMDHKYSSTIINDLEGMIPGLVCYNNGVNGGGEAAMTIRGVGSFQARTNPLVVVDGLPIEGSIETVNSYEIESISVLKDASAAAIYGARASNGVIVITTKQAKDDKLVVEFNSDITISEKQNYNNYRWATAAQMIELEKYNFNFVRDYSDQSAFNSLNDAYDTSYHNLSPVSRLLMANHRGELSDSELNAALDKLGQNDYRKEWQNAVERCRVLQQYNIGLRTRGKYLSSSMVVNYRDDNLGRTGESDRALMLSYRGDLQATSWLNLNMGVNIINERTKNHIGSSWNGINSFAPYQTMYNADGTAADMEADVYLDEASLKNPDYDLLPVGYNVLDELNMNYTSARSTNIRSFVHANVDILPGWSASAQFQYEDIYSKSDSYYEGNSYAMRHLYNLYTIDNGQTVSHLIPEGGRLDTSVGDGAYYTFRTQTAYSNTIGDKHDFDLAAGFEFRESRTKSYGNLLLGYDDMTQTNSNGLMNYGTLKDNEGKQSAMGGYYYAYGAPSGENFTTSDVLHRFYSLYFTGNYTYDRRYSLSASVRLDKTDLFGADPKFRGRPLWSAGASWNINNEESMQNIDWLDVLKLRASYGLTGNIDSSVASYLTATIGVNELNGQKVATLDTPPNDQLRWEKTTSWNVGADYSFFHNRLMGSLDLYYKYGSDLLTVTDLDPTTGFSKLTINNGEMVNQGAELQVIGQIIPTRSRNSLGLNLSMNVSYNQNKVVKVNHIPTSGSEALSLYTLHEGYPVHSLFSYLYAGMFNDGLLQYYGWRDRDGAVHLTDISYEDFTVDDAYFSGTLDPKIVASFSPELTYKGFSLSAMFTFYGGHYMRAGVADWTSDGSSTGYTNNEIGGIPAAYLNYWHSDDKTLYPANGYAGGVNIIGRPDNMDINVVRADFAKLRTLVLGYNISKRTCKRLGMDSVRLRLQMNNIATWVRNDLGIDPEANDPVSGYDSDMTPRSYTMSVQINF